MIRILLLLLLSFPAAFAQNPSSVNVKLFNAVVTSPKIAPPGTGAGQIPNLGQVAHQVLLYYGNAPAHTCTNANGLAELEWSPDNVQWFAFGTPQAANLITAPGASSGGQMYAGTGAFNYVRFNVVSYDNTNCNITAWYIGSQATTYQQIQGAAPVGVSLGGLVFGVDSFSTAPLFLGVLSTSGQLQPLYGCSKNTFATITAGTIGLVASGTGGRLRVCSVVVTMGVTGTVEFLGGSTVTTACDTGQNFLSPAINLTAGTPLALGSGLGAVISTVNVSDNLCVRATTGDARVWINYLVY